MKIPFICPPAAVPWAPNLAMATLHAATRAAGHDFVGFDVNIDLHNAVPAAQRGLWHDNRTPFWMTMAEVDRYFRQHVDVFTDIIGRILESSEGLVAFHASITTTNCALLMARHIRQLAPETYVVCGGPDCFRGEPGFSLLADPAVDAICTGEGETVWGAFLDAFALHGPAVDVPGFRYRRPDGTMIDRGDPPPVARLDDLPFADYGDCDFQRYTQNNRIFMMTSRGCILRCAFCSEGTAFRYRSPESLVAEVERHVVLLRRQSGRRPHIHFSDSLINGRPDLLERFCDLVMARNIDFSWGGMALLRKEMTDDLMAKMRRAGCTDLSWGLESGSPQTLRLMNKKLFVPDLAERIIGGAHRLGFAQYTNIIAGFPGETEAQFQETKAFAEKIAPYLTYVGVPMMELRPNTAVYRSPEKYGVADPTARLDWQTVDGSNTVHIRSRRRDELVAILKDKYCDYGWSELYSRLGIDGRDGSAATISRDLVAQTERLLAELRDEQSIHALAPGLVEGCVDRIEDNRVLGWVWSPAHPAVRVPITVRCGERIVYRGTANNYRGDLLQSGRGDGFYGFDAGLGNLAAGAAHDPIVVTIGDSACRVDARDPDLWPGYADPRAERLVQAASAAAPGAAEALLLRALDHDPDALPAHMALAALRLPGPDYLHHLAALHATLAPRCYVEIGVGPGYSLALVPPGTRAIAIDPAPRREFRPAAHVMLFRQESDAFFGGDEAVEWIGPQGFDLAFIDGDHRFEQVLRDFLHLEAHAAPGAVIALHDTLPLDAATTTAAPRRTTFWSGDAWKAIAAIGELRPEARITTIAAAPTGLTLVEIPDRPQPLPAPRVAAVIDAWRARDFTAHLHLRAGSLAPVASTPELIAQRFGTGAIEMLARFDSLAAWQRWAAAHPALFQPRQARRAISRVLRTGIRIPGEMAIIPAVLTGNNVREGLLAAGLNARERAMLVLLGQELPAGTPVRVRGLGTGPLSSVLAQRFGTGFVDGAALDGCDAVLSCEQLDRIADPDAALRDLAACLGPRGVLIASVPFAADAASDLVLGRVAPDLTPLPDTEGRFLVAGWNLLRRCRRAGFATAEMAFLASEAAGLLDTELPGLFLLVARR